jgi:SPFH domain / Band 7 family
MAEVKHVHSGCFTGLFLVVVLFLCGFCANSAALNDQMSKGVPVQDWQASTMGIVLVIVVVCVLLIGALHGLFHVPFGYSAISNSGRVFDAGWKWHPLGRWLSPNLIALESRNYDLPRFPVRTRDQAEFELAVAVNWRPDPARLPTYVQQGGDKGVPETLRNIITNRLTKWAYNAGPVDWRDALGAHDMSKEALVEELSHQPSGVALVPATANLLIPGEVASYYYRPLGIIIGGVFIKHIEPRAGSKFGVRDLMLEVGFNLPFERQIEQAVKDIEDLDKLERERARMLKLFPERAAEVNRKFGLLKTILFDK